MARKPTNPYIKFQQIQCRFWQIGFLTAIEKNSHSMLKYMLSFFLLHSFVKVGLASPIHSTSISSFHLLMKNLLMMSPRGALSSPQAPPIPTTTSLSPLTVLIPPANMSECLEFNYCNNGNCILIKPSSRISCICNQVGNLVKLILLQNPDNDLLQALRRLWGRPLHRAGQVQEDRIPHQVWMSSISPWTTSRQPFPACSLGPWVATGSSWATTPPPTSSLAPYVLQQNFWFRINICLKPKLTLPALNKLLKVKLLCLLLPIFSIAAWVLAVVAASLLSRWSQQRKTQKHTHENNNNIQTASVREGVKKIDFFRKKS